MTVKGFMCGPRIYEYGGWLFEYGYSGPWPLKKNGWELRKRAGRKFYKDIQPFLNMTEEDQKTYRIGGGCIPI